MFKVIGDNNSEDPKIKRILHILAIILMAGLVLASVFVMKKYKAVKYTRMVDVQKEAQEAEIRKEAELAKKGWVKMIDGEIIGIDPESKKVTVAAEKVVDYIIKTVEINENTQIKILTRKEAESGESDFSEERMVMEMSAGYEEEAGTFDSIKEGQMAEFFFDQRIDPETENFPLAQKINIYNENQEADTYE